MDEVVQKFDPDYNSDEDIADAPNVVQVPPSPIDSDEEIVEGEKSKRSMKNKSKKKQGGREMGRKKKNVLKADKRLTNALKTPPSSCLVQKCAIDLFLSAWNIPLPTSLSFASS